MNNKNPKKILLIINLIVGILITVAPIIITGHVYDVTHVIGNLLVGEFVIRTVSLIIGLIIINEGIKTYFK
ncbi:hypothetical protein RCG19_10710 [Neobacillus sp. OS1-2]|uniref:hypothetical protein n=1 Tax=Neobacillus sp. OS1-2 TaxID=3070680 RepID=UPI0027E06FEE|nr:hypothetical protein [Neobacillus sp. OS1-2]WML42047.1 hypothetical protein RCG19_10710 [Neobacillus sp. OS1-2]